MYCNNNNIYSIWILDEIPIPNFDVIVTVFTVKNSVRNIQTKTELIQRKTIHNNDCNHHYFAVGRLD